MKSQSKKLALNKTTVSQLKPKAVLGGSTETQTCVFTRPGDNTCGAPCSGNGCLSDVCYTQVNCGGGGTGTGTGGGTGICSGLADTCNCFITNPQFDC
jgi:hypothetical protein